MNNLLTAKIIASTARLTAESTEALSVLSGLISDLLVIAAIVLIIIGTWKILQKAGEDGWKAIIPFYGKYTLFKTFWKKKWFWISLIPKVLLVFNASVFCFMVFYLLVVGFGSFMGAAASVFNDIASITDPTVSSSNNYGTIASDFSTSANAAIPILAVAMIFFFASAVFDFIIKVILKSKISKAFGKDAGFTVGLVLLAPVFYMILGCGKAEYQKPKNEDTPKNTEDSKDNADNEKPGETK